MVKIGIEIHQRLDSTKLFCKCDSRISEEGKPDITIHRRLHPVFSELGEVDAASQAEFSKDREFEYQVFTGHNCLVEMDEEPPGEMNGEALNIALEVALHLNATPVDEVHVMRKTVIDGSNTSGFQRTSIVAFGGHIDSSKGRIDVPMIAVEEESAGIVAGGEKKAVYRLDRLGIPLIEVTTNPDIKDGAHLQEVAEKIGMVLRATGKVARGLGTIRQDVNISTEGGARVEIKGAQDLKLLPTLVEFEVQRQTELIRIMAELIRRKYTAIEAVPSDVSSIFKETKSALIANGLKAGSVVLAQKLPSHKGLLGTELQPGRRYGTELSDYAKSAGVKGIIHSDEQMDKYQISESETAAVAKALGMKEDDAFIMVVALKAQAEKAISNAIHRANISCVPEETRRANPDGTSSYMRPLPGKARLYPETDVPPIPITKELLSRLEKTESLDDKRARLEKLLNKEMAARMLKSRNLHLFETLIESGADPMLAATTIEETVVSLRREGVEFVDVEKSLAELFSEFKKGSFVKAAIPDILKGMAKGARVEAVLKVMRLQKLSGPDLEKLMAEDGYDMKKIMQKLRLQADPKEVADIIKRKNHEKEHEKAEKNKDFI
jgi:glutamyl-tRNA(Gln) amidotransferase subunit E